MCVSAHHDGSELFVSHPTPDIGETVDLFVRIPDDLGVRAVHVRSTSDSLASFTPAIVDRSDEGEAWWRVPIAMTNADTHYRFLLDRGRRGYAWLDASGMHTADLPDDTDFRLLTHHPAPDWTTGAVVYQIIPDRFASSGEHRELPEWAIPADWYADPVIPHGPPAERQRYGGDLAGIGEQLDHIETLGATTVSLTSLWAGPDRHDGAGGDGIDQLVGGDQALAALTDRLHGRGLRVIADRGTGSTVDRWVCPPYDLDGWRSDAADGWGAEPVGASWFGSTNHAGFTRPMWRWLADPAGEAEFLGLPVPVSRTGGAHLVTSMTQFAARVPWSVRTTRINELGSRNTARIRTATGDRRLVEVGAVLLMTLPGVPSVLAGDEIGTEGVNGADGRRPFPWKQPERWDEQTFAAYRALIALRRGSPALQRGGLRWVRVDDDTVVFLRETATERLLVAATRAAGPGAALPPAVAAESAGAIETLYGAPLLVAPGGGLRLPGDGPAAHVWRLH